MTVHGEALCGLTRTALPRRLHAPVRSPATAPGGAVACGCTPAPVLRAPLAWSRVLARVEQAARGCACASARQLLRTCALGARRSRRVVRRSTMSRDHVAGREYQMGRCFEREYQMGFGAGLAGSRGERGRCGGSGRHESPTSGMSVKTFYGVGASFLVDAGARVVRVRRRGHRTANPLSRRVFRRPIRLDQHRRSRI